MGLTIKNLSKRFGSHEIIKDYDMSIAPGEIMILLGESGSGKTTLLRMINHLEEVDQGSIELDGTYLVKDGQYTNHATIKEFQRKVGLVFQDYQLFPNLTVMENLLLAPQTNQLGSKEELLVQARGLLDDMGVGGMEELKPHQLSGGQQQRVAIARAMMMNPSLLCFDEPTSALDAETSKSVIELIKRLAQRGIMVFIITHDHKVVDALQEVADVVESTSFLP